MANLTRWDPYREMLTLRNAMDQLFDSAFVGPNLAWQPAGYVKEINESGIPMYLWCGWYDAFSRDGFLMFRNFTVPRKLAIGAWSHSPRNPVPRRRCRIAIRR